VDGMMCWKSCGRTGKRKEGGRDGGRERGKEMKRDGSNACVVCWMDSTQKRQEDISHLSSPLRGGGWHFHSFPPSLPPSLPPSFPSSPPTPFLLPQTPSHQYKTPSAPFQASVWPSYPTRRASPKYGPGGRRTGRAGWR
jgi:hypothetical protein